MSDSGKLSLKADTLQVDVQQLTKKLKLLEEELQNTRSGQSEYSNLKHIVAAETRGATGSP